MYFLRFSKDLSVFSLYPKGFTFNFLLFFFMKNLQYTGAIILVGMGMLSTSVFADSDKSSESHMDSNTRIEATHQSTSPVMDGETMYTNEVNTETAHTGTVSTPETAHTTTVETTTETGAVNTTETTQTGTVSVVETTQTIGTPEVVTVVTPKVSLLPANLSALIDGKLGNMADDTSRVTWLSNINDKIDILATKVTSQKSKDILSELKDLLTSKIDTINGGVTASSLLNGLLQ